MDSEAQKLSVDEASGSESADLEAEVPTSSRSPEKQQEHFILAENIPPHILTKIIRKMPIKTFTRTCRCTTEINSLMENNWKNFNCYIDYEFCIAPEDKKLDIVEGTYDTTFYIFSTTFYEIFDGFLFADIDKIIDGYGYVRFGTIKIGNDLAGIGFSREKTTKIIESFLRNKMTCDQLILQSFVKAEEALSVTRAKKLTVHHREDIPVELISQQLLSNLDECNLVVHSWDSSHDDNSAIFHDILPSTRLAVVCLFVEFSIPYLVNFLQKIIYGTALTREFYLDYWQHPPAILAAVTDALVESFPHATISRANVFPPGIVALIPLAERKEWLFLAVEEWGRWALFRGFIVDSWEAANQKELHKRKKFFRARQSRETTIDAYLKEEDILKMRQTFENIE